MLVVGLVGRVDGLHTHVEAKDEVAEVEPQPKSVGHGYLLIETVELELSSRLFLVIAKSPDVAGIHEDGTVEFPKQVAAVFNAHIQFHVARLVDEVDASIVSLELAGSQLSYAPASHRVGSSREIAFLKGQDLAVSVGIGNAKCGMAGYAVVAVEGEEMGIVHVKLGILGVSDVDELMLAVVVLLEAEHSR